MNCRKCPRLATFRDGLRHDNPDWHNAPVPTFGPLDAHLLVVGLAPGMKGANRTGRPFTGDYAGDLLYETLGAYGFANGRYQAHLDDGLTLSGAMITNAVRCLPPQNKPTAEEIATCRPYLVGQIAALDHLSAILALGRIAHDSVLAAFDLVRARHPFGHGARHRISDKITLFDSYHCSRYNTNTRRLTPEMFHEVFDGLTRHLSGD